MPTPLCRAFALIAFLVCGGFAPAPAVAAGDQDLQVKVQMAGEEIRAQVSMFVPAPRELVWEVITDYERAPEFTRDLVVSRILSRSGDRLRLLQKSQLRYGPFTVPLETVKDIKLVAPVRTESRMVSGSMKKYEATTELVPESGGTRILVRSLAVSDSVFAAMAGESVVKRETEDGFRQLKAEILRRERIAQAQSSVRVSERPAPLPGE
jgi:uncharacterized protein YndB with AHSA1/START domain